MWGSSPQFVERRAFVAVLIVSMVVIILLGLVAWGTLRTTALVGPERDSIGAGSIQYKPVHLGPDATRVDVEVDIVADRELDVYLVAADDVHLNEFRQGITPVLRSGVAGQEAVEWSVDRWEWGDTALMYVVDNTDRGEVPQQPTVDFRESVTMVSHRNPATSPGVYIVVGFTVMMVLVNVHLYRKYREWEDLEEEVFYPYELSEGPGDGPS